MRSIFLRFAHDETGATAIEYALIAGIIAIGIIASLGSMRDGITTLVGSVSTGLKGS